MIRPGPFSIAVALAMMCMPAQADSLMLRGPVGPQVGNGALYIGVRGGLSAMRNYDWRAADTGVITRGNLFPGVLDPNQPIDPMTGGPNYVVQPYLFDAATITSASYTASTRLGGVFSGFVGWDFSDVQPGFGGRIEAEFGRFAARIDQQRATSTTTYTETISGQTTPYLTQTGTSQAVFAGRGDVAVNFALLNYYVDFSVGPFRPYVGAGVGIGHVTFSREAFFTNTTSLSTVGLAWQAGAGLAFDISRQLAVEVGYRFMGAQAPGLRVPDRTQHISLTAHQATAGVRVRF